MEARSPAEILAYTSDAGVTKVRRNLFQELILAFLAGVFIAFASEGSNMAAFNLFADPNTYGLGKVLAGAVFGTGLMLVVLAGGELFTGNTLIAVAALDRKIKVRELLCNWLVVYIGNLIGSLFIAYMMKESGLFNSGANVLGGQTIKIAAYKTALPFHSAFFLGIMCNWLVCLAVWVSYGSKDLTGKILAIFFIICLFITSGFEHSVANMYYIPAGIWAKANPAWVEASHVAADALANLNWGTFFYKNLLPVTLGNIVGGAGMVGLLYWLSLKKKAA
ncbi:FdhC protein [Treponema primitia ZAS-2]|uniref:FdhC protein n=1 Tax=Treponema primitia (strain ATCC BAA-887 / DSM 12427 / ZAS-2) TaxID=545694 RepID=F5YL80_TREPZ|nr:formate/nitrite transporter family protein [Treponema primitia]AEF84066.1 FdhC protein [Treponema primitia ZAS-2]